MDKTAKIHGEKQVEVGDIIWKYDRSMGRPILCCFFNVNSDGWLRVKMHSHLRYKGGEWHSDVPQNFYASEQECIASEIARLEKSLRLETCTESR